MLTTDCVFSREGTAEALATGTTAGAVAPAWAGDATAGAPAKLVAPIPIHPTKATATIAKTSAFDSKVPTPEAALQSAILV
jgi:hypothetical protein